MRRSVTKTLVACFLFIQGFSQTPITDIFTEYVRTTESVSYQANGAGYYFGAASGSTKNNQLLIGFSLPSGSFFYNMYVGGAVKIRRVNNSSASDRRSLLWMESSESGSTYKIFPSYTDSMEEFFQGRIINKGTDNLFGNRGDGSGNNNNIERVDWIAAGGLKTTNVSQSGFVVFERGVDNQHDPFCIAAITALDNNGDPSAYGKIVRVSSSQYGNIPNSALKYTILRKEQTEERLQKTAGGNQNKGGVLVTLSDLGVLPNQVIYGYSLFGTDLPANATPANLVDYTNSTYFPRNTSSNTQEGGIDLIAITGLFNTSTSTVFLPVAIQNFRGILQDGKADLRWTIGQVASCQGISVQKSDDGVQWKTIAQLQPAADRYSDLTNGGSRAFYRIKVQETSGEVVYSPVICLGQTPATGSFQVLRAGLAGRRFQLSVQSPGKERCQLRWYSVHGQLLFQEEMATASGVNELVLTPPSYQGVAILQLTSGAARFSTKVVLQP